MSQFLRMNMGRHIGTTTACEKLRQLIVPLLTAVIVAVVGDLTWELILHTFALIQFHFMHLIDAQVFRTMVKIQRGEESLHKGPWRPSHA